MALLEYAFLQRALLAALIVGVSAPIIGAFVVQRGMSLIGDGVGHVALTGVGLAFLTGLAPVPVALAVTTAGAVALEVVRHRDRTPSDVALAIFFYGGIAGGVVLTSMAPQTPGTSLEQYLFGSITTTTGPDLVLFAVLAAWMVLVVAVLGGRLFLVSTDEEFARGAGMPVLRYNILLAVMVSVTVVLSMRVIGLLLISALMIIPVATAQLLAHSFRRTVMLSALLGASVATAGVLASFWWDTPSGGTIVLLAIGLFALAALPGRLVRGRPV
jgi:zinc transport system permease protein